MKTLNQEKYQTLREGAEVLAADGHGDKVLRLKNGHIMKLFRRKRLFSSALIYPYGKRFADNVKELTKLGIPTVKGLSLYRVPSISRIAVEYQPLLGESLDDEIKRGVFGDQQIQKFGAFLSKLHKLGVYFRSIHLGNVIVTPEGQLGLIDVSDMKVYRRPLPPSLCTRNIRHFCRYPEHAKALFPNGNTESFMKSYLASADLSKDKKKQLEEAFNNQLKKFRKATSKNSN